MTKNALTPLPEDMIEDYGLFFSAESHLTKTLQEFMTLVT